MKAEAAQRVASHARSAVRCPLCGGSAEHAVTARDRNREVTDESFDYGRCVTCGTVFMLDPPADLARYYTGNYHAFRADGEPFWKGNDALRAAEAFRVKQLLRHAGRGHLIEIGAGAGGFATAAKAAGFDVTAVEMDSNCCDYLSQRVGVQAICSDRPADAIDPLAPARAVALWHVLEHLPNPGEILAAAANKLERGGVLAIAIPNPSSLQFRLFRGRWAHLDAPRHLSMIPPETLIARGRELGLRCVGLTTNDPSGLACNLHGWVYALRRRPADGPTPALAFWGGRAITAMMAPVERGGNRGAAVTAFLRKDS